MGRRIAQVVDGQSQQRFFQGLAVFQEPYRETVGLVLVPARYPVHKRRQPECKRPGDQREDDQCRMVGRLGESERPEEGRIVQEQAQHPQPGQREDGAQCQALEHVPHLVVAHLVGQHRKKLRAVQLLQQRVEQDDALGLSESGEVGVGMAGPLGPVHGVDAAGPEPHPLRQLRDGVLERVVRHRREPVEQRRDQGRVDDQHQALEREHEAEDIHPPPRAGGLHEPQHAVEERRPDHHGQDRPLEPVHEEGPRVRLVEAEAFLEHEGRVDPQGQGHDGEDPADGETKQDAGGLRHGQEGPGAAGKPVHPRKHAAEQHQQRQAGAVDRRPAPETSPGQGITY